MAPILKLITTLSFLGILAVIVVRFLKYRGLLSFVVSIAIVILCYLFVFYFFYQVEIPTARGDGSNDIYIVIVLYIFMLLGMVSHYIYKRLEQPKKQRPPFDFGLFIAPVFTSPIVFIPLVAALQNADIDLMELTTPKLMVFFVAFENGFFWKEYFDNRRKEIIHNKGQVVSEEA